MFKLQSGSYRCFCFVNLLKTLRLETNSSLIKGNSWRQAKSSFCCSEESSYQIKTSSVYVCLINLVIYICMPLSGSTARIYQTWTQNCRWKKEKKKHLCLKPMENHNIIAGVEFRPSRYPQLIVYIIISFTFFHNANVNNYLYYGYNGLDWTWLIQPSYQICYT